VDVAAGGLHSVLLRDDGKAVASGKNTDGQCSFVCSGSGGVLGGSKASTKLSNLMPVALTDEQNEERTAAIRQIFNEVTAK